MINIVVYATVCMFAVCITTADESAEYNRIGTCDVSNRSATFIV